MHGPKNKETLQYFISMHKKSPVRKYQRQQSATQPYSLPNYTFNVGGHAHAPPPHPTPFWNQQ